MRRLYIEGDGANAAAYWVDKEGDHIYHSVPVANLCARIRELEAKLRLTEGTFKNTRIRELEAALDDAIDFIDRHSEPWYASGQELLRRCKAALRHS